MTRLSSCPVFSKATKVFSKVGGVGIVGDGAYFLALLRHAGLNRRLVVAVLDLVERRRLERQSARRIERVAWAKLPVSSRSWSAGTDRQKTSHDESSHLQKNRLLPACFPEFPKNAHISSSPSEFLIQC